MTDKQREPPCDGCEERRVLFQEAIRSGDPRVMFQNLNKAFESSVRDVKKLVKRRQEDESK